MPLPRTLIGAGIGSAAGAAGGAFSGDRNQTATQRVGRGILGGMAGAALGTGAHTGLRYRGLTKMKYQKGLGSVEEAALGTKSLKGMANSATKMQDDIAKTNAADAAAKASKVVADDAAFQFAGSPKEMKKHYRKLSLKHHPDRAIAEGLSEPEANKRFDDLRKAYERAIAGGGSKTASWVETIKTAAFFHEVASQATDPEEYLFWYGQLRSLS